MRKYLNAYCSCLVFIGVLTSAVSTCFAAADLDEGVSELAQQIAENMRTSDKRKIAVIEFSNLNDDVTAFGQYLSEELITHLYRVPNNKFEVVERRQLVKVLREQGLGTSGLLDADAMTRVGKVLGVDAIVTGSVTDLGNSVKVNARMISVTTAKIFAVAATNIPKVTTVTQLMATTVPSKTAAKTGQRPSKTTAPAPGGEEVLTKFLKLNLGVCKRQGGAVSCTIYATSLNGDPDVVIYGQHGNDNSRFMDNLGREFIAASVAIGSKNSARYIAHTFVQGVATPIVFTFNEVPSDTSSLSLLQPKFHREGYFYAKFRNVAL